MLGAPHGTPDLGQLAACRPQQVIEGQDADDLPGIVVNASRRHCRFAMCCAASVTVAWTRTEAGWRVITSATVAWW